MLGGSTVWGLGSRDEFTIPSLLAKKLAERSVRSRVLNLGQIGYVTTQEIITLLLELQKGNVPDIVIFYDGFNDTMSAYQMGKAGLPQNEFNRVQEFNSSKRPAPAIAWKVFAEGLSSVRLAKDLLYHGGLLKIDQEPLSTERFLLDGQATTEFGSLGHDVINVYQSNVEIAKALARHFGFKILFYWQPTVFEKTRLTPFEQETEIVHRKFKEFFEHTYSSMRESGLTASNPGIFHDLSRMFYDMPEPVFVDWCHLGETGNARIADRIVMDVLPLAYQKTAGPGAKWRKERSHNN